MKTFAYIIAFLIPIISIAQRNTPDSQLAMLGEKLKSLKKVHYIIERISNYIDDGYYNKHSWDCSLDYTTNVIFQPTFSVDEKDYRLQYNGTEIWKTDKKTDSVTITKTQEKDFASYSFTYNSLISFRNIIPYILKDKTINIKSKDTIIEQHKFWNVFFNVGKRRIRNMGDGLDKMTTKEDFIYSLIIDPTTLSLKMVIQRFGKNSITTKFEYL